METLIRFMAPAGPCGYLPDETWRLEYEVVAEVTPREYMHRMAHGWRRFGDAIFRPRCPSCRKCQSIRVLVDKFQPDRSQRRAWKLNEGLVRVEIGEPSVSRAKLDLYDRYHASQMDQKGWPEHAAKDAHSYAGSFVNNPFPTQEWCYYLDDRLVGVGYVDDLPGGLSAMYFFYDPAERRRSLGTFNVLKVIEYAASRCIPHVYLGYYVANSQSMVYKARFLPNEVLGSDGRWHGFRTLVDEAVP
jgi:arginyl-tRNA--protein-N-Asp/Glu arginylyltransferase